MKENYLICYSFWHQTPIALSLFILSFTLGGKTAQFSIHSCRLESTNTQMLLIFKIRIFITSTSTDVLPGAKFPDVRQDMELKARLSVVSSSVSSFLQISLQ